MAKDNIDTLKEGSILVSRYVIKEVLGVGGFGVTYLAFDMIVNSMVAIKELHIPSDKTEAQAKKCRNAFKREIAIMQEIKNVPFVSRIRDTFEANDTEYIVMNQLKGRSLLSHFKEEGVININDYTEALRHLLIALDGIHKLNIMHMDVSPGNLFLTDDGDIYLIDFGSATKIDGDELTKCDTYFVHPGFNPPEYKNLDMIGPWSDIYSLCATIVYLVTNERVAIDNSIDEYESLPSKLAKAPFTSKQQSALLYGLQVDISKRCQSALELNSLLSKNDNVATIDNAVYYAKTYIGTHNVNQDNLMVDGLFYYAGEDFEKEGSIACGDEALHAVVVCDGVSKGDAGELASRAVAQAMMHFIDQYRYSKILPEVLIENIMDQLNEKIIFLSKKVGICATTIAVMLWKNNHYYVANIGDSPIYLLSKRHIHRLSTSHTMAYAKLMEGKNCSVKDMHTLVNYLGKTKVSGSLMMSCSHGHIQEGDTFLICSDGVSNRVTEDYLKRAMRKPASKCMEKIFKEIGKSKENDNCTAVVLKF